MKNYYNILKINPTASHKDVKNAYILTLKPYMNKDTLTNEEKKRIKDVKRAYFILGDYHNRRKYDDYLEKEIPLNQIIPRTSTKSIGVFDGLAKSFINYMNEPHFNLPLVSEMKNLKGSKTSRYYVQSQSSIGKTNEKGQFQVETKSYINDNGKIKKNSKNYVYTKDGKKKIIN